MILAKTYLDIIREKATGNIKNIEKQLKVFAQKASFSEEDKKTYQDMLLSLNIYRREIDNLYYLYLLEDQSIEYNKVEICLFGFVKDIINSLDYIDKNNMYFEKIIDENCFIKIDIKKLKIVFENIILRIARSLKTGKVTFRAKELQGDLTLEVIDPSRGLPEPALRSFRQTPNEEKREFENLDLYVNYKILEGQGERFDIEKTPDAAKYIMTFHKTKQTGDRTNKKILIIDDDLEFIRLMQLFQGKFSRSGYEIEYRNTAEEGIKRVKELMPDLVLLDLMLPDATGLHVCDEIRKIDKKVPILMLTAYGSELDEKKAYELGINLFINKTYNFKDILDQIQRFI